MTLVVPGKRDTVTSYVPDLSALVQGITSRLVREGVIPAGARVVVHKKLITYLEKLAAEGRATGFAGIEEVRRLRRLADEKMIDLVYIGEVPSRPETPDAPALNALVRDMAANMDAVLVTGDNVSALAAEAMGVRVLFKSVEKKGLLKLESLFDEETMSIHLVEGVPPIAKKGTPGAWRFVVISEKPMTRFDLESIVDEIIEQARAREDSFIEIDRAGSTIVQLGRYRIVITRPPLSSRWEITAVRPLVKLRLEDYNLPEKLVKRLEEKAEGILIAGAPGMGKTTFAQALAEHYAAKGKVVKTIESPRDMSLPPNIVQYSKNFASQDELHDILLLSRPDYTFFDELRGDEDFKLYVDLRLAGIGMVGVLHATTPIDAVQRFLRRVELGMIPSIVDTIIFIDRGKVAKVYELTMTVKLPTGLREAELSRPVVEVRDFLTGELEYEIYTFGEQTMVVPVKRARARGPEARMKRQLEQMFPGAEVEIQDHVAIIKLPKAQARLLSKKARKLRKLTEKYGLQFRIEVKED